MSKDKKEPEPFGLFTRAELEEYNLLPLDKSKLLKGYLFFVPFDQQRPEDKADYDLAMKVFGPSGMPLRHIMLRRQVDREAYFRAENLAVIMEDPLIRAYLDLRQAWIDQRKAKKKPKQPTAAQLQRREEMQKGREKLYGKKSAPTEKMEAEMDIGLIMLITRLWLAHGSPPPHPRTSDQLWHIQRELREPMRQWCAKNLGYPPDMDGKKLTALMRFPLAKGVDIEKAVREYYAAHPQEIPKPVPPRIQYNPRVFDENGKPYKRVTKRRRPKQ
jgi:hypothetical protein